MNAIASVIYSQMGANRFAAMVGVSGMVYDDTALTIRFKAKATNKANGLLIRYDAGSDLYEVTFFTLRGMKYTVRSIHKGVYAEDLQKLFTAETGLATSL